MRKIIYIFIIVNCTLIIENCYAQVYQQWVRKYNGPGINKGDIGTAVAADASGNIYVTGQVSSYGAVLDGLTIKYNINGTQQWLARYHGPVDTSNNYFDAITVDTAGNVYVTGFSLGIGTYNDFATVKYSSSGIQQWVARYNGPASTNDNGRAIAVDASGNVYVTGESYGTLYDFATIKYNSSGVQQWASRYNGPGNNADMPSAIALDQSGNVYVTGYSINNNVTMYATVKYNSSGVQQWASLYSGTANTTSIAYGIAVDQQGNPYVTGRSNQTGTNEDIVTIKYNPNTGDSVWVRKYNAPGNGPDEGYGIAVDRNNNILVTGASNNLSGGTWGIVVVKYNSSGVQQWAAPYTPPGRQASYGKDIVVDSLGNSYIGGYSLQFTASLHTEDYLTARFDSNGVMQWLNLYNGPGNDRDEGYGIAIDPFGNCYITGLSYAGYISGACDYATVKYLPSGAQDWVARYNEPINSNDYISAMKVDRNGNILVAGTSDGSATGTDMVLIKFNSIGDTQWVSRYNGPTNSNDNATCMDVDSSGNVYVGGGSWAPSFQLNKFTVLKYNSSGTLQWSSQLDEGGYANLPASVATDMMGNVYAFGITGSSIFGHYLLVKYNASGDTVWTRNMTNHTRDNARKVLTDASGNIYITGVSSSHINTIKFSPSGDSVWSAYYNSSNNGDEPNDMFVDNSGNVYVTGDTRQTTSFGSEDMVTIKYNSSGVQQWAKLYNGPGNYYDAGRSIYLDTAGNVFVTGVSYGSGTNYDYVTIKYDPSGNLLWTQRFNGPANNIDIGTNIKVDVDGNSIIGGCTKSGTSYNLGFLKYNSSGVQQWQASYTTNLDSAHAVCFIGLGPAGVIYIGSTTFENGTDYDILLAKYSELIGISKNSNNIPKVYRLYQNYPNPFNPATKIKFDVPMSPLSERGAGGFTTLTIYDLLGREVSRPVNQGLQPGTYEIEWDATNYPSGVYFYKLTSGNFSDVKKLVLLK